MKALLISSVYGILALKETLEVIKITFNNQDPIEVAQYYLSLQKGEVPPIFNTFIDELSKQGYSEYEFEEPLFTPIFNQIQGSKGILTENHAVFKDIRKKLINILQSENIIVTPDIIMDRSKIVSEFMIKEQVAEISAMHDYHIKQSVESIIDLDKSINFFSSRLREWYGLHFPELTDKLIDDNRQFAEFVAKIGMRDNFTKENLISILNLKEEKAILLSSKAKRSMGGKIDEKDYIVIQSLANKILDLFEFREQIENYISTTLDSIAPNMKAVLGAPITSKLISIAGSLERLAQMSSSTIQILGAEKALFKALRSGGATPKYGVIFQWHVIRSEKSYLRGKIARMIAGKISILAKVDYYKGEFIGDQIKEQIERKIGILQKQYPRPPKPKKIDGTKRDFPDKKLTSQGNKRDFRGDRKKSPGGKNYSHSRKPGSFDNKKRKGNKSFNKKNY